MAPQPVREAARLGVKLGRLLRSPVYRRGLRHGVGATIEHEAVTFGHDFSTVVDVGAGRGQFALFSADRFPGARLYCLEPLPKSLAKLEQVARDLPNAQVIPVAASSRSGATVMHVTADSDSSSLLAVGALQTEVFPGSEEISAIEVTTSPIDDVLDGDAFERPVLLKIDVQGAELDVLHGAERVLPSVDEILVECSFVELYQGQALATDVICHLAARGFSLRGFFSPARTRDGRWLQADLLFARGA